MSFETLTKIEHLIEQDKRNCMYRTPLVDMLVQAWKLICAGVSERNVIRLLPVYEADVSFAFHFAYSCHRLCTAHIVSPDPSKHVDVLNQWVPKNSRKPGAATL